MPGMRQTITGQFAKVGDVVQLPLGGLPVVEVGVFVPPGGAFTGVKFVVEGSGNNRDWKPLLPRQSDTGAPEPSATSITVPDNTPRGWTLAAAGQTQVRARCLALATGPCNVGLVNDAGDVPDLTRAAEDYYTTGGRNSANVGAAAGPAVVVKAGAGRLCKVAVNTSGSAATVIYDNASAASGTKLFTVPANPTVGTVYDVQIPCQNGIVVAAVTNSSDVSIGYD